MAKLGPARVQVCKGGVEAGQLMSEPRLCRCQSPLAIVTPPSPDCSEPPRKGDQRELLGTMTGQSDGRALLGQVGTSPCCDQPSIPDCLTLLRLDSKRGKGAKRKANQAKWRTGLNQPTNCPPLLRGLWLCNQCLQKRCDRQPTCPISLYQKQLPTPWYIQQGPGQKPLHPHSFILSVSSIHCQPQ